MSELESLREQVKDLEARLLRGKTELESAQADISSERAARMEAEEKVENIKVHLEETENALKESQAEQVRDVDTAKILSKHGSTNPEMSKAFMTMANRAEKAERELEEARKEINRLVAAVAEHVNVRCDYQRQVQAKDTEISKLNAEILRLMEEVERLDQDGGCTRRLKEDQANE